MLSHFSSGSDFESSNESSPELSQRDDLQQKKPRMPWLDKDMGRYNTIGPANHLVFTSPSERKNKAWI